jgi:ribosomal protein S12 methylthiotransferase
MHGIEFTGKNKMTLPKLLRYQRQLAFTTCTKPSQSRRAFTLRAPSAVAQPDSVPTAAEGSLKVSMVSLGCPKNTVDGEVLLGDLFRAGFEITDVAEDADAVVINTCGFVEDAKTESLEAIVEASRLKEEGRVKKVVITGCLAQRYGQELAEQLPEADLVVGFERYGGLSGSLREVLGAPPEIDQDEYIRRSRVQVRRRYGYVAG